MYTGETQACTHVNGNSLQTADGLLGIFPAWRAGSGAGNQGLRESIDGVAFLCSFIASLFGGMPPFWVDGETGTEGNPVQQFVLHGQCFEAKNLKREDQMFWLSGFGIFL